MFKKMESKKKKTEHRWLMFVTLSVFVCVFLSVCVVNANDEVDEESLSSNEDSFPESLIDKEIDNIDNSKKNSDYAGFILGRFVDSLTMLSYKSFSPYNDNKDLARMYSLVDKDNRTLNLYGSNSMWEGLFRNCGVKTSLTCVKRNVYEYLNQSIETDRDFPVTDSILFTRNGNEPIENKYDRQLNNVSYQHDAKRSVSDNELPEQRSFSSFPSLTNALYDKGVNFIMTHDLVLQLPDMLFDGAVVRISPRSLEEDGGAMLKVELNQERNSSGEGRILFKKRKYSETLQILLVTIRRCILETVKL
jgi:Alkyl sulfatase and related hydrolases